jgi:hypothetical protein
VLVVAVLGLIVAAVFATVLVWTQISPHQYQLLGFEIMFDTGGYVTLLRGARRIGIVPPLLSLGMIVIGLAVAVTGFTAAY